MQADASSVDAPMVQALELARRARLDCPPNPAVGCVLVGPDGAVLGQGFTQPVGQAHAEVMALRDAAAKGHAVAGSTAYVTLEPCSHHGRTGPCCEALISAGVKRVVASLQDPNPKVGGNGFARLRAAGVEVEVGPGALEAREMNIGFFSRMVRGIPWVRMKAATSLDGRTALPNKRSQWITSAAAREDGHLWRARACAILTGIGTVLEDDPRLDARVPGVTRQPALVIVDSRLETPPAARLWSVAERRILIYTASQDSARQEALIKLGAQVIVLPNQGGKVDLAAVLRDLGRREVNELHVEAGYKLNGSLLREGQVDELLIYQAPLLLGDGAGIAALGPFTELTQGVALEWVEASRVGADMRFRTRVAGREQF
ncbi:bifunctional diaminohydroxyphosphoribosylaminopyrimidine deaminase/5-amino-6-(5-phosphoribosylamino)uracil reductase RibD [Ottowia thiooxydans]|uniref:bifunctional diaminohydroxyphosphoribosylaminopyrimidine deaminase/5-amino-6-(5-phosphoribosylamino)uracil reductase RibD n=1 Tax=Ottowia thiooxydans TaxID=219182 RepID=UPI000422910F|nr:bifunctional diaminohydroxyphosphoribosylaminopyrimidine deaminase/5-amino-6-(5-phosphoribosylamino)uracil reductase RibD [Ottowia thiooxydans]